jgi:hypothetical protein
MAYSQSWLESNSARRCILVEATVYDIVAASNITKYFSTTGYLTTSSDVFYQPLVAGGLKFTESLALGDTLSMTYGDIELNNQNGELDLYLDPTKYIWVNGAIKIYYGDPTWVTYNIAQIHIDFLPIFDGVIVDLDSRSRTVVNIKLRDKLQRLNTAITESKLGPYGVWGGGGGGTGNGQTNIDTIIPIVFGEVFNMSPMLIDPSTTEYYLSKDDIQGMIDIRDNGVPITAYTITESTGKIKLTSPAVGQVTASVQGRKLSVTITSTTGTLSTTYTNKIASLIALIATQYGSATNRLSLASNTDIDYANFNYFDTTYPQPVGIVITDRQNTLEVCNQLAGSISGQLFCTKAGKLQILILGVPISTSLVASVAITTSDIINPTLSISSRSTVVASTKLGYAKNWTVQTGLVTAIPQQHKDSYATEFLTTTVTNTTVQTNYKLNSDPVQKDTLLLVKSDAVAEATRLNAFYNTIHTIYSFTGTARLMSLQLGQQVTLTHPRFGLSGTVTCQVISLSPDWTKGLIDIEVITV